MGQFKKDAAMHKRRKAAWDKETDKKLNDDPMSKVEAMPAEMTEQVTATVTEAKQGALANMIVFPLIMLACYIGLILYFRGRGGYKPVELETPKQ